MGRLPVFLYLLWYAMVPLSADLSFNVEDAEAINDYEPPTKATPVPTLSPTVRVVTIGAGDSSAYSSLSSATWECNRKWPELELFLPLATHYSNRDSRYYEYETLFLRSLLIFWPLKVSNVSLRVLFDAENAHNGYANEIRGTFDGHRGDFQNGQGLHFTDVPPSSYYRRPGDRQQLMMLWADNFTDAEYIGFVDSDAVFLTYIDREDLFENGKPVINAKAGPTSDKFWSSAPASTYDTLHLQESMRCMSYFPVIIKREHIKEMRDYITWLHTRNHDFAHPVHKAHAHHEVNKKKKGEDGARRRASEENGDLSDSEESIYTSTQQLFEDLLKADPSATKDYSTADNRTFNDIFYEITGRHWCFFQFNAFCTYLYQFHREDYTWYVHPMVDTNWRSGQNGGIKASKGMIHNFNLFKEFMPIQPQIFDPKPRIATHARYRSYGARYMGQITANRLHMNLLLQQGLCITPPLVKTANMTHWHRNNDICEHVIFAEKNGARVRTVKEAGYYEEMHIFEYFDWTDRVPIEKLKKYYNDRIDRIKHCSHKVDPEEIKVIMKRVQDMGSGGWERRGRRDLRRRALLTAPQVESQKRQLLQAEGVADVLARAQAKMSERMVGKVCQFTHIGESIDAFRSVYTTVGLPAANTALIAQSNSTTGMDKDNARGIDTFLGRLGLLDLLPPDEAFTSTGILVSLPCLAGDSFGNQLGEYFETMLCARQNRVHFLAPALVKNSTLSSVRRLTERVEGDGHRQLNLRAPRVHHHPSYGKRSVGSLLDGATYSGQAIYDREGAHERDLFGFHGSNPFFATLPLSLPAPSRVEGNKAIPPLNCPCKGSCHEWDTALMHRHMPEIGQIMHLSITNYALLRLQLGSIQKYSNDAELRRAVRAATMKGTVHNSGQHATLELYKKSPEESAGSGGDDGLGPARGPLAGGRHRISVVTNKEEFDTLPFVPEAAIHYRCGDNLVTHYGFLPFRVYGRYIPVGTSSIYVMAEAPDRKIKSDSNNRCHAIFNALMHYLHKQFPEAQIAVLRGQNIFDDLVRLSYAPTVICSVSTFCLWPAVSASGTIETGGSSATNTAGDSSNGSDDKGRRTTTYFPVTKLLAKNRQKVPNIKLDYGTSFRWLTSGDEGIILGKDAVRMSISQLIKTLAAK